MRECGEGERCPKTPQRTSSRTRRLVKALDREDVHRRRYLSALVTDEFAIAVQLEKGRLNRLSSKNKAKDGKSGTKETDKEQAREIINARD